MLKNLKKLVAVLLYPSGKITQIWKNRPFRGGFSLERIRLSQKR